MKFYFLIEKKFISSLFIQILYKFVVFISAANYEATQVALMS